MMEFHMALTGYSSRPFFLSFSKVCISSSSGIYSRTKRNLSKSPKFSISSHTKNVCCGIIAICETPFVSVSSGFVQLLLYTKEVEFSRILGLFLCFGVNFSVSFYPQPTNMHCTESIWGKVILDPLLIHCP